MWRDLAATIGIMLLATGCTVSRETQPQRTATEQLLISTAADRGAQELKFDVPADTKVFVDAQYFEGTDSKYAIGTIRDRLAKAGARLVADRGAADMVVEIRSGAQSIDEDSWLIGIPSFDVPIPFAGTFKFPEIAFFKEAKQTGVAKMAMTGYDQKDGALKISTDPTYGFSHRRQYVVMLFVGWTTDDLIPKDVQK